jgi:hypothetical protein
MALFFPFFGLLGLLGFVFLKYAIPVMTLRWWILFGSIKSADPDLAKARRTAILVSVISLLVLLLAHVSLFGLRV